MKQIIGDAEIETTETSDGTVNWQIRHEISSVTDFGYPNHYDAMLAAKTRLAKMRRAGWPENPDWRDEAGPPSGRN